MPRSTASSSNPASPPPSKVTNLSGRGVGMDVVKRNIVALRGSGRASTSQPGVGTTVTVRLPLTLAIINGFQVSVGNVGVRRAARHGRRVRRVQRRGRPRLHRPARPGAPVHPPARPLRGAGHAQSARQNIVVVKHGSAAASASMVDALLGEAQTVIKPLSKMFAQVKGISGSSILGSGDVALILDVPVLMEQASAVPPPPRSKRWNATDLPRHRYRSTPSTHWNAPDVFPDETRHEAVRLVRHRPAADGRPRHLRDLVARVGERLDGRDRHQLAAERAHLRHAEGRREPLPPLRDAPILADDSAAMDTEEEASPRNATTSRTGRRGLRSSRRRPRNTASSTR